MTTPRKGRPRKGSLEFKGKSWRARLTVTVEGESVRKWFDLGTQSRVIARRKLARLMKEHAAGASASELSDAATKAETVSEAAERILDSREVRDVENDQIRFRLHIDKLIGSLEVTEVRSSHIRDVLDAAKVAGKSKRTLVHIRRVLNLIFDALWREEILSENPVARVRVPGGKSDNRERAVLTDEELAVYLAWEHPQEQHQAGVRERQTLACVSRMFGGLRTGDMHALKWESFNVDGGRFPSGWAPRKKTARPQLLAVPDMLKPILRDWWERAGKPTTGLMFPALRGAHAGEGTKTGVSHAGAFRRDLRRAFGIEVLGAKSRWAKVRDLNPRARELFEDTELHPAGRLPLLATRLQPGSC
jgi:integrase